MKSLFAKSVMVFVITLSLFGSALGVAPAHAATLTVTNTSDSGTGSLRDTLASAALGDTINFDSSLAGATIHLASTLTISQDVIIDGSALTVPVAISGDSDSNGVGDVPIFMIASGVTVVINSLVLTKGNAVNDNGGAISNNGTLTINNSTLVENHAQDSGYSAGAIYSGNVLTVNNSNFLNNTAPYGGGAIQAVGTLNINNSTFSYSYTNSGGGGGAIYSAATTTITNSTFTHNTAATVNGGGIYVVTGTTTVTGSTFAYNSAADGASIAVQTGTLNVSNSTFASNTAGTGIAGGISNHGTVNLYNSTFSDNTANVGADIANFNILNFSNNILANAIGATNCYNTSTIGTNVNNLIENNHTSCGTELLNSDPQLGTLADNGGPTQTMTLLPGSPAIDAGDNATCAAAPVSNLDQRGLTRPFAATCDLGAVEYVTTYVVTKAADTNDGTCDSDCSLREAVIAANADPDGDSIIFNGDYTITLGASLPSATDELTIDGTGHAIILDGASNYQIMDAQASLHLKNLTIQHAFSSNGGAILTRSPSTITNVTFDHNTASSNGGAIYNYQTTLTITNSTFNQNTSTMGGGAIKNDQGTLTISNSSFNANSTAGTGGAIIALYGASNVTTTLYNSTFSGNVAATQTGGIYNNGTLNYANTIIANSTGSDCTNDGTLGFNFNNLVEDGSCSASLSGDPNLGTLANNGGSTQTLALLAASIAINAGNNAVCLLAPVNNLDQRDLTRAGNGPNCDIGAYEYQDSTAPTVTSIMLVNPNPTAKTSPQFLVTFSEAVSSVDVADFSLTATVTGASVSTVSGSGTTRTVTVNSGSGNGTLRLDIPNTASITDTAMNALSGLPYTSGSSYTINKTLTFTSTDSQDGWVLESSETSNAGGTLNSSATTFNLGDDATRKQYRGILSFNTSSIPDNATITGVTLKVKQSAIVGGGNPVNTFQGFMVDIKTGFFGTTALLIGDFSAAASKSYGPFKPTPVSSWYSISLTSGKAYINKLSSNSGLTQIRLRFKLDDNTDAIANYLRLFSGNASTASRPQLVITYSVP